MIKLIKQFIYINLLLFFGLFLGCYIGYLAAISKAINPPKERLHPEITEEQKQQLKNKLIEIG